jgi:ABC-type bacteriocin/lantibiotic exporter with double-glycine peptidase domain
MEHIQLQGVSFSYEKNGPEVLSGIDLSVEKGAAAGIAGANGCGKSTLLQLIAHCLKPLKGTITLRACSKSGILALQTPKFYLAGSKRARKSGFLRSITAKIHNLNRL